MKKFIVTKKHIITLVIVCFSLLALDVSGVGCPFFALTGMECPTCGATRAIFCLLSFDIEGYLFYNPMAAFLIVAMVLYIFQSEGKAVSVYYVVIAVITFAVYLMKLSM